MDKYFIEKQTDNGEIYYLQINDEFKNKLMKDEMKKQAEIADLYTKHKKKTNEPYLLLNLYDIQSELKDIKNKLNLTNINQDVIKLVESKIEEGIRFDTTLSNITYIGFTELEVQQILQALKNK